MTKKILVGLPAQLLSLVDQTATAECRTRSDLVREALRRYVDDYQRKRLVINENILNIQRLENSYAVPTSTGNSPNQSVDCIQQF